MESLEERLKDAEKIFNAAAKGAGLYTLAAIGGELINSQLLMALGIGGLIADTGMMVYYGLKINSYKKIS